MSSRGGHIRGGWYPQGAGVGGVVVGRLKCMHCSTVKECDQLVGGGGGGGKRVNIRPQGKVSPPLTYT